VSIPGWFRLCIGIDLATSAASSSVNGQLSQQVTTVSGINDTVTDLLPTSSVGVYVEVFTQFKMYSLPISQVVPGSKGDLLHWNIEYWDWDVLTRQVKYTKADIDSLGGTRYLAIPSKLTFRDAVSDFLVLQVFLQFILILYRGVWSVQG
jgi:hypothetical protein